MPLLWYVVFCRISDMRSPLRGGVGGYMFPGSSEINWLVPLFPQILFSYIPCSLILSRFPSEFGRSSSVLSHEINAIFPCSPNPLRMPLMHLTDRPGQWAQQSIIHIVWLQSNQIE